jgi:putative spermidine/putrescine transport system substrate-binding protein
MSVVDHPGLTNRMVNDPKLDRHRRHGNLAEQGRRAAGRTQASTSPRSANWDQLTPLYTEGTLRARRSRARATRRSSSCIATPLESPGFASGKTDWATFVPGVYNADTLGIRPDLVGREITTWADLFSPDFKGKAAIQNIPTIGIMDAMMALRGAGEITYGDKGNPTREELEARRSQADRAEEGRPFPRAVEHLRRVGEPDGLRRGGDPVDVVAGGHRRASQGIPASTSRSRKAIAAGATASP